MSKCLYIIVKFAYVGYKTNGKAQGLQIPLIPTKRYITNLNSSIEHCCTVITLIDQDMGLLQVSKPHTYHYYK